MRRLRDEALAAWGTECLLALSVPLKDAQFVATRLVQTSLWGIDSHGIARLPHYMNRLEAGSIHPDPDLKFTSSGPCTGKLDGAHGLGLVTMNRATEHAISLAQDNGLGFIGVSDSSHCGAIGIFGRMIAEAGLLGIVMTHSDSFVAPHRGFKKFLGTNPLCLSAPNADGPPICLDMATSAVPWNVVMNARLEGRSIDAGLAYNEAGQPTTSPDEVACLRPMGAHKGYALAFMIEIFCGPLNGSPWGPSIPAMYGDTSARRHLGSFVGAIDPARFAGGAGIGAEIAAMADAARREPALNPAEPVLAPGDDQYATEELRRSEGIPVDSALLDQIAEWSRKLNVSLPWDEC